RGSVLRTQASGSLRSRPLPAFGRTPPGACGAPPTPGPPPAVPSPTSLFPRGGPSCPSTGETFLGRLWSSPPACWGSGPEGRGGADFSPSLLGEYRRSRGGGRFFGRKPLAHGGDVGMASLEAPEGRSPTRLLGTFRGCVSPT